MFVAIWILFCTCQIPICPSVHFKMFTYLACSVVISFDIIRSFTSQSGRVEGFNEFSFDRSFVDVQTPTFLAFTYDSWIFTLQLLHSGFWIRHCCSFWVAAIHQWMLQYRHGWIYFAKLNSPYPALNLLFSGNGPIRSVRQELLLYL